MLGNLWLWLDYSDAVMRVFEQAHGRLSAKNKIKLERVFRIGDEVNNALKAIQQTDCIASVEVFLRPTRIVLHYKWRRPESLI